MFSDTPLSSPPFSFCCESWGSQPGLVCFFLNSGFWSSLWKCVLENTHSLFIKPSMEKDRSYRQRCRVRGEKIFCTAISPNVQKFQSWSPRQFFPYRKRIRHLHREYQKKSREIQFFCHPKRSKAWLSWFFPIFLPSCWNQQPSSWTAAGAIVLPTHCHSVSSMSPS